jgi:hypothetical protein
MLKKLTPGDRFRLSLYELNRPPRIPALALANIPADFVQVSDRRYKLRHPQPVPNGLPNEAPASPVEAGTHASPERNFLWIPWLPGKVSYAHPQPGLPIITGLMSGCWLALFRLNGQTYFGHIGTEDSPNAPNSLKAKNAWKIAIGRGMVTPIGVFNPAATAVGDAVFGAVSANNHLYTISCTKGTGGTFIVAGITRAVGQPHPVFLGG